MQKKAIAIYGGGGFAREVAWLISAHDATDDYDFLGYIDDADQRPAALNGKPVFSFDGFCQHAESTLIAIGIGKPAIRRTIAEKCAKAGYSFATLWHKNVEKSDFISTKPGVIVCAGSILTVNIDIDEHVHINLDCTIGHDVKIGAFTTLAPGVHVSGNVTIGENVYIGTGANIINGEPGNPLVIGDGCVIGAGACITNNTEPYTLYAGVPATAKKQYR